MTYEQQEDQLYNHLSAALSYLKMALKEQHKMADTYGQMEYGRLEEITEAHTALNAIVHKF